MNSGGGGNVLRQKQQIQENPGKTYPREEVDQVILKYASSAERGPYIPFYGQSRVTLAVVGFFKRNTKEIKSEKSEILEGQIEEMERAL